MYKVTFDRKTMTYLLDGKTLKELNLPEFDTHPKATVFVKGREFGAKYIEETTMAYEYAGYFEKMTHVCIDDAGIISHLTTVDRLLYYTDVFIEFEN